ncbi:MAG: trypsin-like serine protease, partial [Anaeroplasmataceae bacterium]|nr:trypsin-like serine protease [Anaeroplasmataceae bacterium]
MIKRKIIFLVYFICCSFLIGTAIVVDSDGYVEEPIVQSQLYKEVISDIQSPSNDADGYNLNNVVSRSASYDSANMINFNMNNRTTSFQFFNENSYAGMENISTASLGQNETSELISKPYIPSEFANSTMPTTVLGDDDRTRVTDSKSWPYLPTCLLDVVYKQVYNNEDKSYYNLHYFCSGFMEGPNLLVTAGHCIFGDITTGKYDDNKDNRKFPDEVKVYAGANSIDDVSLGEKYPYYAKVSFINIQKAYYENDTFDYDWAALELDRDLGNRTGYYGRIRDWYSASAEVYSYGYPTDKTLATMWESYGKLLEKTTYTYRYDFDSFGGQSGSPVFMTDDDGVTYVCGIHTHGSTSYNGGTIFNSFIMNYLRSIVARSKNESLVATIKPADYGFADAYPTDDYTKTNFTTHTLNTGFTFKTKRYRTGYIHDEYIVMSPFRKGITEAFIEYQFDDLVTKIEVDLSHWRNLSNEWTYSSDCTAVLRIKNGNSYVTVLDLLSPFTYLPTDRTNPTTYTIFFPTPVSSFEFYMESKNIFVNESNRGRIC